MLNVVCRLVGFVVIMGLAAIGADALASRLQWRPNNRNSGLPTTY